MIEKLVRFEDLEIAGDGYGVFHWETGEYYYPGCEVLEDLYYTFEEDPDLEYVIVNGSKRDSWDLICVYEDIIERYENSRGVEVTYGIE